MLRPKIICDLKLPLSELNSNMILTKCLTQREKNVDMFPGANGKKNTQRNRISLISDSCNNIMKTLDSQLKKMNKLVK